MKCAYCGEEEGTEKIPSPNFDEIEMWDVCKDCKEVIKQQQNITFGSILAGKENDEFAERYGNKIISEANNKLQEIAERTGKPIMVAEIRKQKNGKYAASSIEFTGEK